MIRKMLGLAFEAMKVEVQHLLTPEVTHDDALPVAAAPDAPSEPAPLPAAVAAPVKGWRHSNTGHMHALASLECPDCGAAKRTGWYVCPQCQKEPRRVA